MQTPNLTGRFDPFNWFFIFMAFLGSVFLIVFLFLSFKSMYAANSGKRVKPGTIVSFAGTANGEEVYQLLFLSQDVRREHVYINAYGGEVVFWMKPEVNLARSYHLNAQQIQQIRQYVVQHQQEIDAAWKNGPGS